MSTDFAPDVSHAVRPLSIEPTNAAVADDERQVHGITPEDTMDPCESDQCLGSSSSAQTESVRPTAEIKSGGPHVGERSSVWRQAWITPASIVGFYALGIEPLGSSCVR